MSPRDKQFEDWLNGKLDKTKSQQFENDVMNDEEGTELGERMKTAKYVEYLADTSQERDVPEWDRTAGIEFEENHLRLGKGKSASGPGLGWSEPLRPCRPWSSVRAAMRSSTRSTGLPFRRTRRSRKARTS